MVAVKHHLGGAAAAMALGLLGLSVPLTASAIASYDGLSSITFTVLDKEGGQVLASGGLFDQDAVTTGNATASAGDDFPAAPIVLDVGDSVTFSADVLGTAIDGTADSFSFVDGFIDVTAEGSQPGFLDLGWEYTVDASATADPGDSAYASASLFFADNVANDVLASIEADTLAGTAPDPLTGSGTWTYNLDATGAAGWTSVSLAGQIDAAGNAQATDVIPAPVPATLALLGLGIAGIGYQRRRNAIQ